MKPGANAKDPDSVPGRRGRRGSTIPPALAAAAFAGVLGSGPAADAITPAELLTPDLETRRVNVAGLRDGRISFFDETRQLRSEPTGSFVQLRGLADPAVASDAAPSPTPALDLVDGQRLPGEWLGGDAAGGAIRWRHPVLGELSVPIEDTRRLARAAAPPHVAADTPAAAAGVAVDRVALATGETLVGFVDSVGADELVIEPEGIDAPVAIPLDRVVAVSLANPVSEAHTPRADEHLVVLADDTRLLATGVEIVGDEVTFTPRLTPGGEPITAPLSRVRRIEFVGAGWRLLDLADHAMTVTAGGEVFGVPMRPAVAGDAIRMHAPVDVAFEVPPSATRFAATASLEEASDWVDFEVVFPAGTDGGAAEERFHLHAEQPTLPINIPLTGQLRIRLEPGLNGPILDRLRLTDAVLLTRSPVAPADTDAETRR